MTDRINLFFEKNIPAGKNIITVKNGVTSGLIFCSLFSLMTFIVKFVRALSNLYYYSDDGKRYINEKGYHVLHDFEGLLENCFSLFPIFFAFLVILMISNYSYHFQGSKSIYTMLRAGKNELIRRCVAIPLITILLSFISMGIILGLCIVIYILFLPEIHL